MISKLPQDLFEHLRSLFNVSHSHWDLSTKLFNLPARLDGLDPAVADLQLDEVDQWREREVWDPVYTVAR